MDFGNAVLVVAAIVSLTAFVKKLVPNLDSRITQVVSLVLAVGTLFLVRETVWAHSQVIGDKPLDQLDGWSVLLAGLLVGLGANVLDRTLKSVSNIGANTTKYEDVPPG